MSSAQYLYRRPNGCYVVRLCVPEKFKAAAGKSEIHRSTGCRDYRLAKIFAAELATHWHRAIRELERMDIAKVKAGSIELLGDGLIFLHGAASRLGANPLDLGTQLAAGDAHFYVEAVDWLGWSVDDIHEALDHDHDDFGNLVVTIDPEKLGGPNAQTRFTGLLRLRFRDYATAVLQIEKPLGICQFLTGSQFATIDRGFVLDLPGQFVSADMLQVRKIDVEALRLRLAAQFTPEMLSAAMDIKMPLVTPSNSSPYEAISFSMFRKEYTLRQGSRCKPDQVRRRDDQFQIFMDLMGDLPLARIGRQKMREFADLLAKVPDERHNVKRKYGCPTASFKDLIALADRHALPRLTINSRHRILDGLSEIFGWAVKETMMTTNPGRGLGDDLKKAAGGAEVKPQDQREQLSVSDLAKIFSAPWFAAGTGEKTVDGRFYAYRPHYYWLPLLALHAGGRINELSQLYLQDVKTVEGVACIHFNLEGEDKLDVDDPDVETPTSSATRAADKSLKTVNADRFVPLHKTLIDLGFLKYLGTLREAGYNRLFPELLYDANKGYGKAAGKWFNERFLGQQLRIPRNGKKTFHSMRHNFATALGATNPNALVQADLLGHTRGAANTGGRYDKGVFMNRKTYLDLITHGLPTVAPFNCDDALQAIRDAQWYKHRRMGRT